MKTNFDGIKNGFFGRVWGVPIYVLNNKIDPVEVESYVSKYYDTVINTLVVIGLIVVILSPFIIDYFTK